MKVTYRASDPRSVEAINPALLLAEQGSLLLLGGEENTSAYCGLSFLDPSWNLIKCLHDIRPLGDDERELRVAPGYVERVGERLIERWSFVDGILCYQARGSGKVRVSFDIRDMYDRSTDGRPHVLSRQAPGEVLARCRGHSFTVLTGADCELRDEWRCTATPFDAARGGDAQWWTYDGVDLTVAGDVRLVVAPEGRSTAARRIFRSEQPWNWEEREFSGELVEELARASLRQLVVRTPTGEPGILAGLPWFFQTYTRDEAIACGALIGSDALLTGRILRREIAHILSDGRVPNRFPSSDTGSADGVGWAFLRLMQLRESSPDSLTEEQWRYCFEQLRCSLDRLGADGRLLSNGNQETWMDTHGGLADTRPGVRVEIQALTFRMLLLASALAESFAPDQAQRFSSAADRMREAVSDALVVDGVLCDGISPEGELDRTTRPNVLLALYIAPDLLPAEVWHRTAEAVLSRTLLRWGAVASIDTSHPWFAGAHTGENDRSYHRGDAWYFLSNLAAVGLLGLSERYAPEALSIYGASVDDLLRRGAAGHCSEISSADEQSAWGCWCQAWSASSLIELHRELSRRHLLR